MGGGCRSKQEKVGTLLDKICTTNQKLEYVINLCRFNHNVNYLAATNFLVPQIRFISPEQKPSQQKDRDRNKKMCHVLNRKIIIRLSAAMALIYMMQKGSSQVRNVEIFKES